jgi:phage baseplate assembly protein W
MTDPVAPAILGTGIAFPFAVGRHREIALTSGVADVEQAIRIILATAPGDRPCRPEFGCGVHALVFEVVDAATIGSLDRAIRTALHRWEPRIEVDAVAVDDTRRADGLLLVEIAYRLRHTTSPRNLVYPFYLIPADGSGA